jgi:hypothetical protein
VQKVYHQPVHADPSTGAVTSMLFFRSLSQVVNFLSFRAEVPAAGILSRRRRTLWAGARNLREAICLEDRGNLKENRSALTASFAHLADSQPKTQLSNSLARLRFAPSSVLASPPVSLLRLHFARDDRKKQFFTTSQTSWVFDSSRTIKSEVSPAIVMFRAQRKQKRCLVVSTYAECPGISVRDPAPAPYGLTNFSVKRSCS